jgi:acetyl-CoA carboxylase biotin carboxyl carrier protein
MGSLDIHQLRALLDLLTEKDIAEFEHEDENVRFRIVRGARVVAQAPVAFSSPAAQSVVPPVAIGAPSPLASTDTSEGERADFVDVTSPFVGTFYRAPSPDVPPFSDVGSVVRPGQTLCIIEAMKLMNEIESECAGTVVEIFAQNGKSVEFGQKLFRIKKA